MSIYNFVLIRLMDLELEDKTLWTNTTRKFAITATALLKQLELIEVKPWGVEWYNSEYKKVRCFPIGDFFV